MGANTLRCVCSKEIMNQIAMCGVLNKEFYTVEKLILEEQLHGEVPTLHGQTNKDRNGSLHLDCQKTSLVVHSFGTREL